MGQGGAGIEVPVQCCTECNTESLYTFLQATDDITQCKNDAIVLRKQSDKAYESRVQKEKEQ